MAEEQSVEATLAALFEAERRSQDIHDELADRGRDAVMGALRVELDAASEMVKDDAEEDEGAMRLICLSRLLGEFEGPDVADALIDVLDTVSPEARREAGEQLKSLAYDRFKEVALAVERALERLPVGSPALVEMPFLLLEIPEGGVIKLLTKFLEHAEADVVAAAIVVMADIGDPSVIGALESLQDDTRVSTVGDEAEEIEETIGELATAAIEVLEAGDEAGNDQD